MRDMFLIGLLLLVIGVATPISAQTDATLRLAPHSNRYSLDVPTDWVTTQDGVRGLSGTFVDETLAIADSEAAMQSLQSNNPDLPVAGKTLVADIFPVATITGGQTFSSSQALFEALLQAEAENATFFTADGRDTAQVENYPGPPYGNNEFAGLTMILDDNLIYFMVYAGPDATALAELASIAASLVVNPTNIADLTLADTLGTERTFEANTLQVPLNTGWMVLSAGTPYPGLPSMYMILPESTTLDYILVPSFDSPTLPGAFIQVQVVPYDARFSSADYVPTEEDLSFLMVETLAATGGEPDLNAEELILAGVSAQRISITGVFGGDNRGTIVLLDAGDTLYTITFVAPADQWESLYLPLAESLLAKLSLTAASPDDMTVGLQVGQLAPNFTLNTLDGQVLTLDELRGQTVILNFWATWCPPCRAEMPEFQRVYSNQSDSVEIVAINLMEDAPTVQAFIDELGLTFPIAMDSAGDVNSRYQIAGYPSSYVIDAEGVIRVVHVGPAIAAQIDGWLQLAE